MALGPGYPQPGAPSRSAIAGVIWFLLYETPLGRKMYAVGGNPDAARYSGINVKNTRLIAFAICGVTAAAAGILQSANNANASNLTATRAPWMLQSIAAVFLGMAMFRNGLPNLPGTLLGVVIVPAGARERSQLHRHPRRHPIGHQRPRHRHCGPAAGDRADACAALIRLVRRGSSRAHSTANTRGGARCQPPVPCAPASP